MWGWMTRSQGVRIFLLVGLICVVGCSAQQQHDPQKDMLVDASDPFSDPFFTKPPDWDDSVLQQSEVLAEGNEEAKKPQSFLDRTEGVIFSTVIVGASLAQMALPFLGL